MILKKFAGKIALCAAVLVACFMFGCYQPGPIPDGEYGWITPENNVFQKDYNSEAYWRVEGNKGRYYLSGSLQYKCNIIEEKEKIYFEGYEWTEIIGCSNAGKVFKYEVQYDEETKSITLIR